MSGPIADIRTLVDIHREPWSTRGWGDYPAAHIAKRISDALDRGEIVLHDPSAPARQFDKHICPAHIDEGLPLVREVKVLRTEVAALRAGARSAWDEGADAAATAIWADPRRPRWAWRTPVNPYLTAQEAAE